MMTVRRLEDSGDIATSGQQFITEQAEVAQTIATRLRLFVGEYFRNINEGVDWFGKVLGKGQGLYARDAELRRVISQTENVLQITKYNTDFDLSTRKYTVDVSVLTSFGEVSVSISSDDIV